MSPKSAPIDISNKKLLDHINNPSDIKTLSDQQILQLADEVRTMTIEVVSKIGGHLGASLGVVELTTALHAVFDTPEDKIIWDVGHQCYPHKILTGRKDKIHTLRQKNGLSGFTKRSESEFDPFGAGHSSTSISVALGMATASKLSGKNNHTIAVIGDGALSAGMAFEALNNAAETDTNLIIILNDNQMSIAPPTGGVSRALKELTNQNSTEKNLFENMGLRYEGPIDGHNIDKLLKTLRAAKKDTKRKPLLIHVQTQKGKGYSPAERASDKMHGVKKFDIISGNQATSYIKNPTYTQGFVDQLIKDAKDDKAIVAITAAMPDGTGLDQFAKHYPDRFFDVGIAEQHAVTFAAGLAAQGMKPFVAIYSTFLQRAYDQIIHDVAIQNLPVRFMIDRAGLVGADGATHAGSYDIAALSCIPNMTLMAPSDLNELHAMVSFAASYNDGPIALRYPRGEGTVLTTDHQSSPIKHGKGRIIKKGKDIAILSYGTRLTQALNAAQDINATCADARFAKPLDTDLVKYLTQKHETLVTIEEGSSGGFASSVLKFVSQENLTKNCQIKTLHLPDNFQDHAQTHEQYTQAGLLKEHILKCCSE
ncbi:MAG: 1-deoxy-D-xylulose-5-phosphate synthase [Bdellovibrionales bacterium]